MRDDEPLYGDHWDENEKLRLALESESAAHQRTRDEMAEQRVRAAKAEAALASLPYESEVELAGLLDAERAAHAATRKALATMVDWAERGDQNLPDQFPRFCADLRSAQAVAKEISD